ncbi:MAG TPA: Asp-tRNA(Asn)/Glu-tRNA(Gln) amidotransferase subunit GatA [Candidatus Limiplasma sp.]|nr:Asp-tRNA(Asn)/Glu-tRNA(Gln) amidotransferase subunit GatA [Candidatus Limiplasma sp.]HPS81152.1 Asp-tRNA(Asn)/Glu-tRNA(Gln) amidotransferase subunit GatA [Candidatus Limiplasma sp.]
MRPYPEICKLTVVELIAALKGGELTASDITQAYLDSIAAQNGVINAYLDVFAKDARKEAAASDARRQAGCPLSALDGIPVAVKDNMLVEGTRCTCASKMLQDFVSPYSATAVEKLRAAGMVLLGKLNMDEFAMGSSTENSAFGVCRNPWALDRVPGGSSGGAAAAVAAGMAPVALGSDTGGSIRQPASFCGVVGVKPAYGTVSRYGLVAFASSLDQIGPLCKTAEDAAMVMSVIAGRDRRDATSDATLASEFPLTDLPTLTGLTIGMPRECFGEGLSMPVYHAVQAAAEQLRAMGANVVEVSVPSLPYALSAYYVLSSAEASSNLARFDGVRYGYRVREYADLDELYRKSREEGFGLEVKRRIMLGTFALSSGYQDQYYLKAQQARELLRYEFGLALENCDALLTPVAPTYAYKLGEKTADPMEMYMGDLYTVPANLTGLPNVSVPCGCAEENGERLPVGMSLLGARDSLGKLLSIAAAYERQVKPNEGLHPYDRLRKGGERV